MNQLLFFDCCKRSFVIFILLSVAGTIYAQPKKARVLFVGNSYTYFNNMPQIVADIAASAGDTLDYDMSAPGGSSFFNHVDPSSTSFVHTLKMLRAGGWDYVVLQEQSINPAMPPENFYRWSFPYAKILVDSVRLYNPCAAIIFYMTWGRKNGIDKDVCRGIPGWLYLCTYHTMDSVIRARYMEMSDSNNAIVSPVGAVWRYIRNNYPGIELYESDESHPSPAGSYAAACAMYTAIFKKPVALTNYSFSLGTGVAGNIKTAADKVVSDSLDTWHIGQYKTTAGFTYNASRMNVGFTNTSANATRYDWDFGDWQTATAVNPVHNYTAARTYAVRLISSGATCRDTAYARIDITPVATGFIIAPSPATNVLYITSALFARNNYRIQLVNNTGQLVYDQRASRATTQAINVSGMATGIYTVNICAGRMMYRKKIIIQ